MDYRVGSVTSFLGVTTHEILTVFMDQTADEDVAHAQLDRTSGCLINDI